MQRARDVHGSVSRRAVEYDDITLSKACAQTRVTTNAKTTAMLVVCNDNGDQCYLPVPRMPIRCTYVYGMRM